jgi:hypothetical protein
LIRRRGDKSAHFKTEYQRTTLSRIAFARAIESEMTVVRRGEGRLMLSSRASLIPAMIDAAITSVEEKPFSHPLFLLGSRRLFPRDRPLHLPHECTSADRTGFLVNFMDSLPR